ncbi:nucleoporin NDC1 [Folsomia candida]|uniref:Nucleoporin NDC1 n=1 Tax=Folsomia candida TaxID=158441 RepID=A0A226EZS5_FOLCA|nr:nucleoporin NDC1 [Folsomia candida]OXA62657.1 Nucleoporin NDC1 [Folsomia candida]
MSTLYPTTGIAPPARPPEVDKRPLLSGKYATILISRVVQASFIICLVHIFALIWVRGFEKIFNFGSGDDDLSDKSNSRPSQGMTLFSLFNFLPMFIQFVAGVLNPATFWILLSSIIQVCVVSSIAKVCPSFPTTRQESVVGLLCGKFSGGILATILIGLTNAIITHSYLSVATGEIELLVSDGKSNGGELKECPGLGGPSVLCWTDQRNTIILLSALYSTYVFFKQYVTVNFVMAFPTIDLQMGDRFRCSVSKAWNDCKQYVTFFATFDLVLVGLNTLLFIVSKSYLHNLLEFGILFNFRFFLHILIWPSVVLFSTKLVWRIVEIVMTEKLNIPLESKYPSSTGIILLRDAMQWGPLPMKFLAFFEFNMMACMPTNQKVMENFFTLSHPGYHARNWTGVMDAVLSECTDLIQRLDTYSKKKETSSWCPAKTSTPVTVPKFFALVEEREDIKLNPSAYRRKTLDIRDLKTPTSLVSKPSARNAFQAAPQIFKKSFSNLWTRFWNYQVGSVTTRVKSFAQEKNSAMEFANILSTGQPVVIWGMNGLVEIATHSFVYDQYGAMQRDVNQIISVLLTLYQTLDEATATMVRKVEKVSTSKPNNDKVAVSLTSSRQLVTSILFSLTRLHGSFHLYYNTLGIPASQQEMLYTLSDMTKPQLQKSRSSHDDSYSAFIPTD